MKKHSLRLARIAITSALYVVLSLAIMPLTFGLIQIRFSEMLLLLCFYNKDYCYSMTLGCAVTNCFSPLGIVDVLFGTLGTILTVICIRYAKRIYLAWIPPTVFSITVALEFFIVASEPFWLSYGTIALGELIAVGVIGTPVFMLLERNKKFLEFVGADRRYIAIMQSIEEKRHARLVRQGKIIDETHEEITLESVHLSDIANRNIHDEIGNEDKKNS